MPTPILTCLVGGRLVAVKEAGTNEDGRPVHSECDVAKLIVKPPEYVAISPVTLACPRCNAEPGEVCEVPVDDGLELVHVERIRAAAVMDAAAKNSSTPFP